MLTHNRGCGVLAEHGATCNITGKITVTENRQHGIRASFDCSCVRVVGGGSCSVTANTLGQIHAEMGGVVDMGEADDLMS